MQLADDDGDGDDDDGDRDDGYFVMKVILWWNLSRDESNLVMKVMIVKELMTGDVSPVAMFPLLAGSQNNQIWNEFPK